MTTADVQDLEVNQTIVRSNLYGYSVLGTAAYRCLDLSCHTTYYGPVPPSWHVSMRAATQTSRRRPVCHALQRRAGIEGLKRCRPCDVTGKIKSTLRLGNRDRVAVIQHRPSRLFYCPTLLRTCYWVATLPWPAIITRAVAELASKSPEVGQIFHSPLGHLSTESRPRPDALRPEIDKSCRCFGTILKIKKALPEHPAGTTSISNNPCSQSR